MGLVMRVYDLKQKEVINECDCKRLGFVSDIIFDECSGCIQAIVVPGHGKLCGLFARESEYIIPYKCVRQIGSDIVLVKINEEDVLKKCNY